jgi:hypothetical protein
LDISSPGRRQHNLPLNGAYRTDQIYTESDLRFPVARKPAFSEVWLKAEDYPEEKWPFLVRLISLFQLSFPLDEDGQRQLVPALLPVEEPPGATEPDDQGGRIRLRYEFNVIPAPLVPRLLVRTFGLIKDALHWRRGALLRYGPATSKVWATQDERWIYATISGSQEARDATALGGHERK